MKLTMENWSRENIKNEIEDFSHVEKVKLAAFCAEKVIGVFESKYPNDKRARLAIEAAKEFTKNPTDENKCKCEDAAYAAADAAYAAGAAADAAYAADAAAEAAYAAYAADAAADAAYAAAEAAYAAYAADAAADAAYAAYAAAADDNNKFKREVIVYINSIKNRADTTHKEDEKPVYTQELMVRGGVNVKEQYEPVIKVFSGNKFSVYKNESGKEYVRKNSKVRLREIDIRTDKEKLIDDIAQVIGDTLNYPSAKDVAKALVERFDITLK